MQLQLKIPRKKLPHQQMQRRQHQLTQRNKKHNQKRRRRRHQRLSQLQQLQSLLQQNKKLSLLQLLLRQPLQLKLNQHRLQLKLRSLLRLRPKRLYSRMLIWQDKFIRMEVILSRLQTSMMMILRINKLKPIHKKLVLEVAAEMITISQMI